MHLRTRLALLLMVVLFAADQISKQAILGFFEGVWPPVWPVTSFFNLVLVWNHGVSFGFFGGGDARWFLVAFTFGVTIFLANWWRKTSLFWERLGLSLIISGALGNLVDRVVYGAVVDFLDFHAFDWHFWAFNVADSAITLGVIALLLESLFPSDNHDKTAS